MHMNPILIGGRKMIEVAMIFNTTSSAKQHLGVDKTSNITKSDQWSDRMKSGDHYLQKKDAMKLDER